MILEGRDGDTALDLPGNYELARHLDRLLPLKLYTPGAGLINLEKAERKLNIARLPMIGTSDTLPKQCKFVDV